MFDVLVRSGFTADHALRHYHGATEPLHPHDFKVEVIIRGKKLQNKVKYLTDFVVLQRALDAVIKPMDHVNLNNYPPFVRDNPSAENLARFIARELAKCWRERGARLVSVAVWETAQTAARYWL
ncbi:MAG: 6-carboxytetrahydropterin synthase [Elusimicrobiota bacterium]|jgi:6-pyruvoyltetrahydropterin/6-carboxytetrahydropterin synthase